MLQRVGKLLFFSIGKKKKKTPMPALDVCQGASYLAETSRGAELVLLCYNFVLLRHYLSCQWDSFIFRALSDTVMAFCTYIWAVSQLRFLIVINQTIVLS